MSCKLICNQFICGVFDTWLFGAVAPVMACVVALAVMVWAFKTLGV